MFQNKKQLQYIWIFKPGLNDIAERIAEEAEKQCTYLLKPLKKPFGVQSDGDLWSEFWSILQCRGARSIKVSRVKGHAKEEHIERGEANRVDKEGNDEAHCCSLRGLMVVLRESFNEAAVGGAESATDHG